eukprot:SAG11_NODE_20571_length_442_cov_16.489796_1_plen_71_part_01
MVKGLVLVRSNAKGLWSVFGAFLSYYGGFLLAQQKMTPQVKFCTRYLVRILRTVCKPRQDPTSKIPAQIFY